MASYEAALTAHICTLTREQRRQGYEAALRASLTAHGFTIPAGSTDPLPEKLTAARTSRLCVLLLGPDLGPRDPLSSFSDTELEVSAARDHNARILVFAEQSALRPLTPEQQEFIDRMTHFTVGVTRAAPISTPSDLLAQLEQALAGWQPAESTPAPAAPQVHRDSVLISSTSDDETGDDTMRVRRALAGTALRKRNLPVIDYLLEPSQDVPPVELTTTWARECRLLLVILGRRYGYVSPVDGLGGTELEFVTAFEARRPVLAFVGHDAMQTPDPDQRQFVDRVRALLPAENVVDFTSHEEFVRLLGDQLTRFEAGRIESGLGAPEISTEQALSWYRRQTERWLGVIPHLTQPRGMPLEDIFVSLETFPREEPGAADPRRVFVEGHGNQTHYSLRTIVPIDVEDALKQYSRLVLRGDPGTGKSITLRWYAINAPRGITPIFVRLASYAAALAKGEVSSLLDYISREERRLVLSSAERPSRWLSALSEGTARLLLDALDEVPWGIQQQVASEIDSLSAQLSGATRIVVSTRMAGSPAKLGDQFVVTQVQPLRRDQQRQLAERWFTAAHRGRPDEAANASASTQRLMSWLSRETQISEWARVPLLMTFLAALSDTTGGPENLPTTKAMLYRRVFRLMLTRWETLNLRSFGQRLWLKESVMLELARQNILEGQGEVITPEAFARALAVAERGYQVESGPQEPTLLLNELIERDGVMLRIGDGLFAFQHPTLQEYLAAVLLAALPREDRADLLTRKRLYARWDVVTQFCVSELDRLQRRDEADEVVWHLIRADARPVAHFGWRDPLRLALLRAAHCQGGRGAEDVRTNLTVHLVAAWWHIWWNGVTDPRLSYVVPSAEQAFRALGQLSGPIIQRLGLIVRGQPPRSFLYNFAVRALSTAGAPAAPVAAELRQALRDPDKSVRSAAALALGSLGEEAEPALDDLCRLLDDPSITDDSSSVFRATVGASNIDEETGRDIRISTLNPPPSVDNPPACAANALMQLGSVSVRAQGTLNELFPTLNAYGRQLAIRVLGSLWTDAAASLEVLSTALQDDDVEVRFNAVSALGCVGPAAAPLAGQLLSVMRETLADTDGSHGVHWAAIWAIRELGFGASDILDDLREDLRQPSGEARRDVLFLLEQMGPVKQPLLAELRTALFDEDTEVRWTAARAIATLGPAAAEACDDLRRVLEDDPEAYVRVTACRALGALGTEALTAWDALARAVATDTDQQVRGEAALAIGILAGHVRGPEGLALLREQIPSAGDELRIRLVRAIAQAESARMSPRADLFQALLDADPKVRAQSASALAALPASVTSAVARIRHALRGSASGGAGEDSGDEPLAMLEIGIIQPLEKLRHAARDPDEDVRTHAVAGLGNLTATTLSVLDDVKNASGNEPMAAGELEGRLSAVTSATIEVLRQIARNPSDPLQVPAATALSHCGSGAALSVIEDLYPLLCDPDMSEAGGPSWGRRSLGRNSPLGQGAEGDMFVPPYPETVRETIAAILRGTEDAGPVGDDAADNRDVTQERHRVPLTLALLLDRGDTLG